jgi:hypothetical protein
MRGLDALVDAFAETVVIGIDDQSALAVVERLRIGFSGPRTAA